jgi:hypothetical protein
MAMYVCMAICMYGNGNVYNVAIINVMAILYVMANVCMYV